MPDSKWSIHEAKDQLSAVVEAAQTEPQTLTKHGKERAIILGTEEYARLKRIEKRKKPSFTDFLLSMPRGDIEFERPKIKPRAVKF